MIGTKLNSQEKSQSGFAHMAVIIVLVLAVVIGAGYMVYSRQQDKSNKTTQASTTQTSKETAAVNKSSDVDSSIKELDKSDVDSDLNTSALDADLNAVL